MGKVWAKRVDANQPAIVAELRKHGFGVRTNHDDILVAKNGITLQVEIKAEGKRKRLRPSQVELKETWPGAYIVATSAAEIMAWEGWQ
jgi:hypothetical protein